MGIMEIMGRRWKQVRKPLSILQSMVIGPVCAMSYMLLILLMIPMCFVSPISSAATMNEDAARALFNRANTEFYQQQRYKEAREAYDQIIRAGISSPDLFYNMGNACARIGNTAEAIAWYERAKQLAPRDPDIRANLKRLEPVGNQPQHFLLMVPFAYIVNHVSLREWMAAFLVFFYTSGIAGSLYFGLASTKSRGLFRRIFHSAGVVAIAVGLFAGVKYYQSAYIEYAIVTKPNSAVYSGPGDKFSQVITAPEGTKVQQLDYADSKHLWVQIQLMDGQKGFIPASTLQKI